MTPVQRLTGDFITSIEIGHLKRLGTVMCSSSLPIVSFVFLSKVWRERTGREVVFSYLNLREGGWVKGQRSVNVTSFFNLILRGSR